MIDLTVDLGVVMSGAGQGDPPNADASRMLMREMLTNADVFLALDSGGKLRVRYAEKMGAGAGLRWLETMASRGKVRLVDRANPDKGTVTQLKEAHFDWEDYDFVRVAAGTDSGRLVSHDPDYSKRVRKVLSRRLNITIESAQQALDALP